MWDMYAVPDDQSPAEIEDLPVEQYLGSLALDHWARLTCIGDRCQERDIPFSFFHEARWSSADVATLLEIARQCRAAETHHVTRYVLNVFIPLLERAAERGCGIAAYAD